MNYESHYEQIHQFHSPEDFCAHFQKRIQEAIQDKDTLRLHSLKTEILHPVFQTSDEFSKYVYKLLNSIETEEHSLTNHTSDIGCCYECEDGRKFNYLSKIKPPKSTQILIHTQDDKVLLAHGTKTKVGWDFILQETQTWIDESEVKGWAFPQ